MFWISSDETCLLLLLLLCEVNHSSWGGSVAKGKMSRVNAPDEETKEKNWACVESLEGPRCVYSPLSERLKFVRGQDQEAFYSEDDCLSSSCYQQGPTMLKNPNLVSLVSEYLDFKTFKDLIRYDQLIEAATAKQLANLAEFERKADATARQILSRPIQNLPAFRNDLVAEAKMGSISSETEAVLAGIVYQFIIQPKPAQIVRARTGLPDAPMLSIVKDVFPDSYSDFVWAFIPPDAKGTQADWLDFTDKRWASRLTPDGIRRIGRLWGGWIKPPGQLDGLLRGLSWHLDRQEASGAPLWGDPHIVATLLETVMDIMFDDNEMSDSRAVLLNNLLKRAGHVKAAERLHHLRRSFGNLKLPISRDKDALFATYMQALIADTDDLSLAYRLLEHVLPGLPLTRLALRELQETVPEPRQEPDRYESIPRGMSMYFM